MAGGRRHMPNRTHPIRPPPNVTTFDDSKIGIRPSGSVDSNNSLTPKHIPMPDISNDSDLLYEIIMFIYTATACGLQFLHMYRSVWWLPNSYNKNAMNFYLIDHYLVGFILTILSRQMIYCAIHKLLSKCIPTRMWPTTEKILKIVLLTVVICILLWCSLAIIRTHQLVNILYLGYPMSVYFILFGLHAGPFFSSSDHGPEQLTGEIIHACPPNAPSVRSDTEKLKQDFNARMRHVLFSSVLSAYYAAFVPCCFAQSALIYDVTWATQHLVFVWLGTFTMAAVHVYPVSYVDVLHRAAVHLGRWTKLEGCRSHLPTHTWQEVTVWPCGSLVRHSREIFRAEGVATVGAEPGNTAHARFHAVFYNPGLLYASLFGLQGGLVISQLGLLVQFGNEWWRGISLALMLFINYYTLFKVIRDTFVCWRLFKNEKLLQNKLVTG